MKPGPLSGSQLFWRVQRLSPALVPSEPCITHVISTRDSGVASGGRKWIGVMCLFVDVACREGSVYAMKKPSSPSSFVAHVTSSKTVS